MKKTYKTPALGIFQFGTIEMVASSKVYVQRGGNVINDESSEDAWSRGSVFGDEEDW